MPKSTTFAVPSGVTNTFPALRSRCRTPRACAASSPRAICSASPRASSSGRCAATLEQIVERRPFYKLTHDEWTPIGYTVREHLNDVRVSNADRGLSLALETLDILIIGSKIRPQDAHDDLAVKLVVESSVHVRSCSAADAFAQVKTLGDLDHIDS